MNRDLREDLKVIEAATKGKWRRSKSFLDPGTIVVDAPDRPHKPIIRLVNGCGYDLEFVVAAREGWPEAIHRALAAEAKIQNIEQAITEALRRQYSIDEPKPEQFLGVIRELRDRALAAEERVRELEEALERIAAERPLTGSLALTDLDMQEIARKAVRKGLKP